MYISQKSAPVVYEIFPSSPATHCDALRHTATHCTTLQHTATRYTKLGVSAKGSDKVHISRRFLESLLFDFRTTESQKSTFKQQKVESLSRISRKSVVRDIIEYSTKCSGV